MNKLINRIKAWIYSKRLVHTDVNRTSTPTIQEDIRDQETKKRVGLAFEAQCAQIRKRSMKQHSCNDPISCRKRICFKLIPDKIIAETVVTKAEVDKELGR